ncbi:10955_t:CDS:2, partial [Gigaspora rosea]
NRSVTVEDESSTINSDIEFTLKNDTEASQKSGQANFKANFGHMSVEMLKFLCHEMGVSEADNLGKGKAVDVDSKWREVPAQDSKSEFEFGKAFPNAFNNTPADSGNLGKKHELTKARNQREYNEWCKAGLLLDKALSTGDVKYVHLARQVALKRAYIVRVADKDGWNVAAKIASGDLFDPMSELFGGKREWARMAAPGLFVPPFIQLQQPVNLNWQHSPPQGMFQQSTYNSWPQNPWTSSYEQQASHESPGTSYTNSGTSSKFSSSRQRVLDLKEADHTRVKALQKVEDGSLLNKTLSVTGKLHTVSSVHY